MGGGCYRTTSKRLKDICDSSTWNVSCILTQCLAFPRELCCSDAKLHNTRGPGQALTTEQRHTHTAASRKIKEFHREPEWKYNTHADSEKYCTLYVTHNNKQHPDGVWATVSGGQVETIYQLSDSVVFNLLSLNSSELMMPLLCPEHTSQNITIRFLRNFFPSGSTSSTMTQWSTTVRT